jgi:hypothetical protein
MSKVSGGRAASGAYGGRRHGATGAAGASKGVSAARLSQKSGAANAFGGYAKVKHANGTFSMKRAGR